MPRPKTLKELKIERYEKMFAYFATQYKPGMYAWIQKNEPIIEKEICTAEDALDTGWACTSLEEFNDLINTLYKLYLKGFSAYWAAKSNED